MKIIANMRKAFGLALAFALALSLSAPAQGQSVLNQIGKRAKNAVNTRTTMGADRAIQKTLDKAENAIEKGVTNAGRGRSGKGHAPTVGKGSASGGGAVAGNGSVAGNSGGGTIYYVSEAGNNKNDGLSPQTPVKNLQKALDIAPAGATVYVAEGNYYGMLRSGNIFVRKPVYIYGGFNEDFSARDILTYRTLVQPTPESNGSAKAPTVQLEVNVAKYGNNLEYRSPDVLFDGIIFDRGNSISYYAGNDEEQKGQPEGVETTKMNPIGSKGMGGADLSNLETYTKETCILYLNNSNVDLTVHNCAFINAPNHVILGLFRGSLTIDNNIFVNCRMEAMDARGSDPKENSRIDFTNNTVLFMWSFKQNLETMGYGFRFQPGTDCYLANNIFGCSMFTALDYTHIDSDKNREATRNTTVVNNVFFLNRMGDLSIPGGGNFINISSADFSDIEYIDSESGNTTVTDANIFKGKIDEAYLKGFLNASYTAEMQHNPNSAVNTFRSALGMNQIGTMTSKVTMYANRYNWEKALLIFGAMPGYGAQMPQ